MPLQVRVEVSDDGGQHRVFLTVGGYRFELRAPSAERARVIAWDIVKALDIAGDIDG